MPARIYATEVISQGETTRVRVAARILSTQIDLDVMVETQNAEIALEHAEDKLISALEEAAKELRDQGLHLHEK